jgi:HEPN domain-containing protein
MNEAKRQLVTSWATKAQHDLASAMVLAAAEPPLLDTANYHCQQASEKAIKAFLVFRDQEFGKVHDVEALVRTASDHDKMFLDWLDAGTRLTPYATMFRYPYVTSEPTKEQFDQALSDTSGLYETVLSLLPESAKPCT